MTVRFLADEDLAADIFFGGFPEALQYRVRAPWERRPRLRARAGPSNNSKADIVRSAATDP